jgi:ferritin
MKDLMRMQTSLSEEMIAILNEQVKNEASASAKYLAMASWCAEQGFENSEAYFMTQAEEEREHMLKIFKYINNCGARAISPEVLNIPHEFSTLKEVFESALEQEIAVTASIYRIVDACRKHRDYITENFIQWFVTEQMEEEVNARRAVQLFELIGEDGISLYQVDKAIRKIKQGEEAE